MRAGIQGGGRRTGRRGVRIATLFLPVLRISACSLLACLALATPLAAAPAQASRDQTTFFEAPRDILNADPATRSAALAQLGSLGVHALRVVLYWRDVAPGPDSSTRPEFDATNPAAYNWGNYDTLLRAAQQRGWQVLLTVSGPVPRWATAGARDNVTRPDPLQYALFMTAVGRHFGSQVSMFSIWNEPNHPQFLDPQYVHGQPASPRIYRALFQAGYVGLQGAGISSPVVLMGETAPTGTGRDVAPITFLREALCLNASYRKASSCSSLPAAGFAHHAYTKPAGPFYRPVSPNDVTIGVLSRLVKALDRAARAGAVRSGLPIYLTEFGIQSRPNKFLGVPVAKQAEFAAISEHIAYNNSRVRAFSQYLLRDDPIGGAPGSGLIGFQSGLEYVNGSPKPSLGGFRLPLVVTRRGRGYSLWGEVRPASGPTSVTVLVQGPGSSRFRVLRAGVSTNRLGYWHLSSSTPGTRWLVRWTGPGGTVYQGAAVRPY